MYPYWYVVLVSARLAHSLAQDAYFNTPPDGYRPFGPGYTHGAYPQDFGIVGPSLEAIHDSQKPSAGLAVDVNHNLYLAYPRNAGSTPSNVVICTSFNDEQPWPDAAIQNCTTDQDPSTCFINVQNVVRDDKGRLWIVDSGIPAGAPAGSNAIPGGAKLMSFNETTSKHLRTYAIPENLLAHGMNMNDMKVNTTLGGREGYAFITDASTNSSLVAIDLEDGSGVRRLFNTSVVRADEKYVGSYDGELIYRWNGTQKGYITTAADGITLASGNLYWGVLASRRFYYISQETLVNRNLSDAQVLAAVQNPGQCASEQAGFTSDDRGRVYIAASEHNAIYYVDTLTLEQNMTVNGNAPGVGGLIPAEDYVVKTLVKNAMIQHADSMAILDGWLYFNTNQLTLGPQYQYNNTDKRRGPFRSFRIWVGRGQAA
ncbi:major royal jelly protein-domain-containing protein [Ampelomyces quisqualis]|uniref:Major royal jelly protein-domain-containing protein n=1 Tax=Ampelomyces quisqualis TaxID=50730 RepID=A0A6A5Q893_AMPQU|nr:major royal jelly protein-domain-containing protein [Ampelomyces quisqualis]